MLEWILSAMFAILCLPQLFVNIEWSDFIIIIIIIIIIIAFIAECEKAQEYIICTSVVTCYMLIKWLWFKVNYSNWKFLAISTREPTFVTSCLVSCIPSPFQKGKKYVALLPQVLSFWSRSLFRRNKSILTKVPAINLYPNPLKFIF